MDLKNVTITKINSLVTVFSEKGECDKMTDRGTYGLSFCKEGQITYIQNGKEYTMELFIQNKERKLTKELPSELVISEEERIKVNNQTAVLTEWGGNLLVGYKAEANLRRLSFDENGIHAVTIPQLCGEYKTIDKNATLEEMIEAINELVDTIYKNLVGKAE